MVLLLRFVLVAQAIDALDLLKRALSVQMQTLESGFVGLFTPRDKVGGWVGGMCVCVCVCARACHKSPDGPLTKPSQPHPQHTCVAVLLIHVGRHDCRFGWLALSLSHAVAHGQTQAEAEVRKTAKLAARVFHRGAKAELIDRHGPNSAEASAVVEWLDTHVMRFKPPFETWT